MFITSIPQTTQVRIERQFLTLVVTILAGATGLLISTVFALGIDGHSALGDLSTPLVIAIALWWSVWLGGDLYRSVAPRDVWDDLPALVSSALKWGGLLLVVLVIGRAGNLDISLAGILVAVGIPCRLIVRMLPTVLFSFLGQARPSRVLIVGSGQIAQLVAASLLKYDTVDTTVVGFIDERTEVEAQRHVLDLPIYGIIHLDRLIALHRINKVVFAFSHLPDSALLKLMRVCQSHPDVEITLIPRFYEAMSPRTRLLDVHGLPLLQVPPRRRLSGAIGKVVFDRLLSGIALLLCLPLLILVALAIRIEGPGPLLFRQPRVGKRGKTFVMYKLRSMREPLPGEDPEARARHTAVGAFLRKFGIDELPQLWNVLRGDMSLVGPRPERESYVKLFREQIPDYDRRHQMRGGLTGLAQIKGLRGATSIVERTRLDNFYVDNWSFWLDIRVILMTFKALVPISQGIGGDAMFLDLVSEVALHQDLGPVLEHLDMQRDLDRGDLRVEREPLARDAV